MRILFAIDPWIYRDCVGNQIYTLERLFVPEIKALSDYGHEVVVILGEDMEYSIKQKGLEVSCRVETVALKRLYDIYPNHYEAHWLQYENKSSKDQVDLWKKLITENLNSWEPEVIISFTTPISIWKECYPRALSVQFENGIFSREPYPYLVQLDPGGFLAWTYPHVYMKQLRAEMISEKQKERLSNLRDIYKEKIFDKYNPMSETDIKDYPEQKVLLVPLSYNGVVINDAASGFKSQLDLLLHVMYHLSPNTTAIVTKHSLQMNDVIWDETEKYLKEKFPNIRFSEKFDKYAFASQWLTPMVDGIVSLNSTIAYHAALWGKKVFALGNCEINSVASTNSMEKAEEILDQGDKDDPGSWNVLYHLLTRYCFTMDKFLDAKWMTERFEKMIYAKENGKEGTWEELPLLGNEDEIFDSLIKNTPGLKENYVPRIR